MPNSEFFCGPQLGIALTIGVAFLLVGLAFGIYSSTTRPDPEKVAPGGMELQSLDKLGPVLQAMTALIGALGKAPAWFALLLAGVLVVWVSGATYAETCKPTPTTSLEESA